jgi:hypothetical protein
MSRRTRWNTGDGQSIAHLDHIAFASTRRAALSNAELWIVLTLTYVIALGDFTHVIAGSVETFLLLFAGQIGLARALGELIAPALISNVNWRNGVVRAARLRPGPTRAVGAG